MQIEKSNKSLFFSYGHDKFSNVVERIKSLLEAEGFVVFLDTQELRAGMQWEEELERGIKNSKKFIFFITHHSIRRPDGYCLKEITEAVTLNKEIIPIAFENEKLPISINRLQYLDFQDIINNLDNENFQKRIDNLVAILNGNKNLDKEGAQAQLLSSLKPIDFTQDFKKHKNIVGREWIIDEVDSWLSKPEHSQNRILWITAKAGYGKSAIASYLVNYHPDVIGIHFCSFNSSKRNDPINVIKTLTHHFQSQLDDEYFNAIKNIDINGKDSHTLVDELILNPLENITSDKNYIFVIDAIDEAQENTKNTLADLIRDKLCELPSNIKIIITSRPEGYLKETFSAFKPLELQADTKNNRNDCIQLIKKLSESKDISNREEFINTLLKQSEANMLYINMFFNAVDSDLIKLENSNAFPSGLNGLYKKDFDRIFTSLDIYYEEFSPIFELLIIYEDFICIELFADILELTEVKLNRRVTKISSFLEHDNEQIKLNHKSLKDWLQSKHTYQVDLESSYMQLEIFFKKLTPQYYRNYADKSMLNYLLVKYFYKKDKVLLNYVKLVQNAEYNLQQIEHTINASLLFMEKEEFSQAMALQKIAIDFLDKEYKETKNINLLQHYIELTQLAIKNNASLKQESHIESCINKIENIFSIEKPSQEWVEIYADMLLEWSSYTESNKPKISSKYIKISKKHLDTLSNQSLESKAKYSSTATSQAVTLLGPLGLVIGAGMAGGGAAAIGGGAAVAGLGLLNPIGLTVGGIIAGVSYFGKKKKPLKPVNKKPKNNNSIKAIELYENNLSALEIVLNANPQKWIFEYKKLLDNILPLYIKTKNEKKAKELLNNSLRIITKLNNRNPNRWQKLYEEFKQLESKSQL